MIVKLALVGLFMVTFVDSVPVSKDDTFKMIILHNNDMHARFEQTGVLSNKCTNQDAADNKCYGGFARVAHEVRRFRKDAADGKTPPVIYLNAGDTYTGTPWFTLYKDKIAAEFLEILKPDATSLGNHEFDEGTKNLEDFLKSIDFPVLAANLDLSKEPGLASATQLIPSMELPVGDRTIGIIGYLTPETKEAAAANDVEFRDEIVAINEDAAKLKAKGINIIIALGHSGLERDKQIAAGCPDIDLVIGGHSHTFLYTGGAPDIENPEDDYPVIVTQTSGKKVPVVQAYAYTKYLGKIHVEFDDNGDLVEIDGTPILLDSTVEREPDVLELLEKYRPGIIALETEIVGGTKVLLDGNCRRHECNMANLIADAFVDWRAVNYFSSEFWTDASIALVQGGAVRASISQKSNNGNVSKEDASTVMPFQNKMEIVEITGQDLMDALEHSVHRYEDGEPRGEFLQFSGVQVEFDINRPSGSRVVDAKVLCADCSVPELVNIDLAKKYRIVMQDFLANGGDGFEMFAGKSVLKTEEYDLDVWTQYLKKKSPIYAAVEWRITLHDIMDPSDEIVGSTRVTLDNNCRQGECNLGNFIADAMVNYHSVKYKDDEFWTDASMAIIQGARVKASIAASTITRQEAIKVFQPATFNLVAVTMTGSELKSVLEHSVSQIEMANNVQFLQVSGIQVVFDITKPVGSRVTDLKVLCARCAVPELQSINLEQEYKVIMQSVLAAGADGYENVMSKRFEELNESDLNVFIEYLNKKSPVYPAVEWRLTFTNSENESTSTTTGTTGSTGSTGSTGTSFTSVQPTDPADSTSTTTLGGANLKVSFVLILMTSIVSLLFKR